MMKSSLTIIAHGRRATHMPTRGRLGARVSRLSLSANRLGFRRVGRFGASAVGGEAHWSVLAKSAGAVSAWHSANARATPRALFAKRPRAERLCPRPLRGADEKGRGRRVKGQATVGLGRASSMLLPRNLPAKPRAGVADRPEMSKIYCDVLTTDELRRAPVSDGRAWPLICSFPWRA